MAETEEEAWWDHWNTKFRATAPADWGDPTRTGWLALNEIRHLALSNPALLEVGCGTGWLSGELTRCSRYVGLDLSSAAIDLARKRVPAGQFVVADFHTWQAGAASFDVVVMVDTIAYFRDQDRAVNHAWSLLKPGGYLVLTTVNPFVHSRMSSTRPPGQGQVRKWLTKDALHRLLHRNGFNVLRSYTACPSGDKGILRWVNSRKLNRAVSFLTRGPEHLTLLKERLGLGQYRVAVARRGTERGSIAF